MDVKEELYEDIYETKFSFGKKWQKYLKKLSNEKIKIAEKSLIDFTKLKNFKDKTFLDFGCGSGLFSLAAINLGAKKVVSIDIDNNSLECAKYLRHKFKISEKKWIIKKGSALDKRFIESLNKFDIVYSWGVLHHTGNMWQALENILIPLNKKGLLYIAIYNNFRGFPFSSKTWNKIKKCYSGNNKIIQNIMDLKWASVIILGLIVHLKNPINYIKNYDKVSKRGMHFMSDVRDWLGGYPYEYAKFEEIKIFYEKKDLKLINIKKTKREGCNEFLFKQK